MCHSTNEISRDVEVHGSTYDTHETYAHRVCHVLPNGPALPGISTACPRGGHRYPGVLRMNVLTLSFSSWISCCRCEQCLLQMTFTAFPCGRSFLEVPDAVIFLGGVFPEIHVENPTSMGKSKIQD